MEQARHILICGEVHVGKSTLIRRLLESCTRPVYGFVTKRLAADETGFHPIYIHPASEQNRVYEDGNRIGTCDTKVHNVNADTFNTLGVSYLSCAKPGGVILMDELGFMEAQAEDFVRAVFAALDGDIPVIAAVKARYDVPFLNKVRAHPNGRLYNITTENRDEMYEQLLPVMQGWNKTGEKIR